jgi:hypothetical protein
MQESQMNNSEDNKFGLNLYHNGLEMMEQLGLTFESEVLFSDYCKDTIFVGHPERIKFTKDLLLFCDSDNYYGRDYEIDDWLEWDRIKICQWQNILEIDVVDGSNTKRTINKKELDSGLNHQEGPKISFPFFNIRKGNITVIIEGRPHSERSTKGKEKIKTIIRSSGDQIRKVLPAPRSEHIQMSIDVFSTELSKIPDIDRFTHPILDAFEGIVYNNDKQLKELKPRCIDSSKAIVKLERKKIGVRATLLTTKNKHTVKSVALTPKVLKF